MKNSLRGKQWIQTSAYNVYMLPIAYNHQCHYHLPLSSKPNPNTCTCTQIEIVWAYLNKMSRKLDSGKSIAAAAAMLAWLKWMYFPFTVTVIPCARPRSSAQWEGEGGGLIGVCLVLEVGGVVDRRRRRSTLQPFLLLGKIALPWPPAWQHLHSPQWSTILGGRRFTAAPCLLDVLFQTHRELYWTIKMNDCHVK